ncbi:Protein of unknown function (DUF1997) [Synechococcus sp. PCC 7502]|uniref:DUF1997 domain-containing protein n=1 Tax=Synechococcus sp. PCC 7502 TaxID=1173263 RepID=UPI00029FBA68|nr:DUF1997 domain-containing protein [Synechococcus sp. PCC 7502]AFY72717.1 Protein of unknown function (DUF1997) [Synechococcus sp. PCC 7502]
MPSNSSEQPNPKIKANSEIEDISFDDIAELPDEDYDLEDDENPAPKPKKAEPAPQKKSTKPQDRPLGEFRNSFLGYMDLYSDRQTIKTYLNTHQGWFRRCASPMKVDPLGNNGYALTIGKVGALGFFLEPKIGLHLLPEEEEKYKIETIPIPNYPAQGYEVDFRAVLELLPKGDNPNLNLPPKARDLTSVEWQLELTVTLHFPDFIKIMPKPLIERTGDAILGQLVRQISRKLTANVQADFHRSIGLNLP